MDRINTATKQVDKFGAGKHGFNIGNPGGGTPATQLNDVWFDGVQEEMLAPIEAAGLAPSSGDRNQVLKSLKMGGVQFGIVTGAVDHTLLDADWGKLHTYTGAGGHTFDWTNVDKAGLNFVVANIGTGDLTLNPTGAQTIDGGLTLKVRPGGVVRVVRISDAAAISVAVAGTAGALDETDVVDVGEAVALNDVIYADAENERGGGFGIYWKVKADHAAVPVRIGQRVAIAREAAAGAGSIRAQVRPGLVDGFTGLVAGKRVYVHPSTAGGISQLEPILPATGTQVALLRLGEARSTTAIWFEPDGSPIFLGRNSALGIGSSLTVNHFHDGGARDRMVRAYLAAIGSTSLDMPGDGDYDGYSAYTFAIHFAAGTLPTGSSVRFAFAPGANGETPRIDGAFFQEAGVGHQSHFASAPVRVTFGGGGHTHTFAANTQVTSDDCAVPIVGAKAYVLRFWVASTAPNDTFRRRATMSGVTSYNKLDYGADLTTVAPGGFAATPHAVVGVVRADVTTASRGEPLASGSETINGAATDRVTWSFSDGSSNNQDTMTTGWNRTNGVRDVVLEVSF